MAGPTGRGPTSILASAPLLLGTEGAGYADQAVLSEPNPKAMWQKEIREFDARLPKKHPF
ncbi:MAG: hypothetical protein C0515_04680 [Novosphingobium sp.]|nr:hypothetical protein [Novosphingobium sp.]